jgi:hypothetical protein
MLMVVAAGAAQWTSAVKSEEPMRTIRPVVIGAI